ncbi:MAG TPA: nuclear transport factor 2 family protein [Nocardioidaceae bacterium]|nr:nuclear transport factor 2 family protein [Nocardioidaceae bacterium]
MLTDGDVIRNLLASYCRHIDAGDFDAVGQLFARGKVCDESGTVLATGAAEVAALYGSTTRRHEDGTPMTQHLVANTLLEPVDDDHVVATSTYVVLQATPDLPLQPIITGTYVDTFVRTSGDERWRFAERRFGVGRVGNLSQHLTIAVEER